MDRFTTALKSTSIFLMTLGALNYGVIAIQNFESPILYKDLFQGIIELQQAAYLVFFVSFVVYTLQILFEFLNCSITIESQ